MTSRLIVVAGASDSKTQTYTTGLINVDNLIVLVNPIFIDGRSKANCTVLRICIFQVRGSLARKALRELLAKGLIKQVVSHNAQSIYTRLIKDDEEIEAEKAAAAAAEKK